MGPKRFVRGTVAPGAAAVKVFETRGRDFPARLARHQPFQRLAESYDKIKAL